MTVRRILSSLLLLIFGLVVVQQLHGCAASAPVLEAEAPERTLILVSVDGFRHDYLDRDLEAPTLRWIAQGVRAERLVPVFPTKTFPNHYSLVTGLHPESHGIVGNSMRDPLRLEDGAPAQFSLSNREATADGRWWGGEPIWVTAERQGVSSATIFWPGSEAEIGGVRPTAWLAYDGDMPYLDRVGSALEAVDDGAGLVTLYFEGVDSAGHRYGPEAPEVNAAILEVEAALAALKEGLRARGVLEDVDVVVVSDHGMTPVSRDRVIVLDAALEVEASDIDWGEPVGIWPTAGQDADDLVRRISMLDHVTAYRKESTPARLHYRDNPRIPPVVLIADDGWTVTSQSYLDRSSDRPSGGTHGFDNRHHSMSGIFLARGPRFQSGLEVDSIQAVDVYGIMANALGLEAAANDGDASAPGRVLR